MRLVGRAEEGDKRNTLRVEPGTEDTLSTHVLTRTCSRGVPAARPSLSLTHSGGTGLHPGSPAPSPFQNQAGARARGPREVDGRAGCAASGRHRHPWARRFVPQRSPAGTHSPHQMRTGHPCDSRQQRWTSENRRPVMAEAAPFSKPGVHRQQEPRPAESCRRSPGKGTTTLERLCLLFPATS